MEKPILLSDFDGVFNVFGNDNFTPEEATTDKNTYHGYSLTVDKKNRVQAGYSLYDLNWASEFRDYIVSLLDRDIVRFSWLSTWCWNNYTNLLNKSLGFTKYPMEKLAIVRLSGVDKYNMVLEVMEENLDSPIVWIDDECCTYDNYIALMEVQYNLHRTAPVLLIKTYEEMGITHPQLSAMADFLEGGGNGFTGVNYIPNILGKYSTEVMTVYSPEFTELLAEEDWFYTSEDVYSWKEITRSREIRLPEGISIFLQSGDIFKTNKYSALVESQKIHMEDEEFNKDNASEYKWVGNKVIKDY